MGGARKASSTGIRLRGLRPGWGLESVHSHMGDGGSSRPCPTLRHPWRAPQIPPSPLPCRSLGRHLIVTGDLSPEPSHSQASGKACPFCTAALGAGPQVTPGQSSKRGQSHPATPQTLPLTTRGQTAPAWPLPLRPLRQAQVSGLCVPPWCKTHLGPSRGAPTCSTASNALPRLKLSADEPVDSQEPQPRCHSAGSSVLPLNPALGCDCPAPAQQTP